jgi:oligopeptide/dipeptide ABC transporter ATP-binding protein
MTAEAAALPTDTIAPVEPISRRKVFARAFFGSPTGVFGLVIVGLIALLAVIAPMVLNHYATTDNFSATSRGPSWSHLIGTDPLGRDLMARLLVAARLSLEVALAASVIALALGIAVGAAVSLVGPRFRPVIMRTIETAVSFPVLLTAIVVSVIVARGTLGPIVGVGIALSFGMMRVTATLTLAVAGREYINAARVLGVGKARLLFRYVLANIAEPLIIYMSLIVSVAIVTISALSFLGLGIQPPRWDWGGLLSDGIKGIYIHPVAALGPAIAIAVTAIGFGFFGEGLARALNPLLWTSTQIGDKPAPEQSRTVETPLPSTGPVELAEAVEGAPPAAPDGRTLVVRDLVVTFPGPNGPIEVVKGVSFAIPAGKVVGVVGESGSGKTMTALAVAQLIPYPGEVQGTVELGGTNLARASKAELDKLLGDDVAVVFQDPMSSLNPALRIGTQLTGAVRVHDRLGKAEANALAVRTLSEVHIPAAERQLGRYPHELSGGMRQRAMIARGLMKQPTLLVADEPTTALDVSVQAQIMDLIDEINDVHHTAILFISHNLALVSQNCDRVLVMYAGRIVEDLDSSQLRVSAMHPYTRALLEAVPELGQDRDVPLAQIPGEVPDIGNPPPGCPFHPRCPLAISRCSTELPPLRTWVDGRRVACHVAEEGRAA